MYADLPDGRQALQKNEDTWCRMLGHLRCRIKYSPERIQRAVEQTVFCTILTAIRNFSVLIAMAMVAS